MIFGLFSLLFMSPAMALEKISVSYDSGETKYVLLTESSIMTGKQIRFFKNGMVSATKEYLEGVAHGVEEQFFKNGQKKMQRLFSEGRLEGVSQEWETQGRLTREFNFSNGEQLGAGKVLNSEDEWQEIAATQPLEGVVKEYYRDGGLKSEKLYKAGVLNGAVKEYLPDGACWRESNYSDGLQDGTSLYYDRFGNLLKEEAFVKGLWKMTKTYNKSGKTLEILLPRKKMSGTPGVSDTVNHGKVI